jgi:hypothetical protein
MTNPVEFLKLNRVNILYVNKTINPRIARIYANKKTLALIRVISGQKTIIARTQDMLRVKQEAHYNCNIYVASETRGTVQL